jgi:hypothetical protein
MLTFAEGVKPENPEKIPRNKGENQQQTQLTYDAESGNRTRGDSDERRALTQLRHPCFPVSFFIITVTLKVLHE